MTEEIELARFHQLANERVQYVGRECVDHGETIGVTPIHFLDNGVIIRHLVTVRILLDQVQ